MSAGVKYWSMANCAEASCGIQSTCPNRLHQVLFGRQAQWVACTFSVEDVVQDSNADYLS